MKKTTLIFVFTLIFISWDGYAQFPESFETAVPPTGWASYRGLDDAGADNDWLQTDADANTGDFSAFVRYSDFVDAEDWLVTPQFTPTSQSNILEFFQRQSFGTDYGNVYDILVSTSSQTDISTFVVVDTQSEESIPFGFAPYYVDLSTYNGTAIYVAFRMSNNFGDNWYIDDVNLIASASVPNCAENPSPSDLAMEVEIPNGDLTLSWTAPSSGDAPTGYQFSFGDEPGVYDLVTTVSGTSIDLVNLALGATYYWQVVPLNSGGLASGCPEWTFTTENPPPPPANDECDNAIALTVNADNSCGTVTSGTTASATASSQDDDVTGTPNNDVWFSFEAVESSHIVQLLNVQSATSADMGMGVYDSSGGCLGLVFFDDSDPNTLNLSGLTPGVTYVIRVYGWGTGVQDNTFDICVGTPPAIPSNDACSDATVVGAFPFTEDLDATSATNNGDFVAFNGCGTTFNTGMNDGVWYTFTPASAGTVDIVIDNVIGWDPELALFSGSCGNFTCLDNSDSGFTGGGEDLTAVNVEAGVQYFINVGYFSGASDSSEGPFTITVSGTITLSDGGFERLDFSFYPNPTNDRVQFESINTIERIEAINMLGQTVLDIRPNTASPSLDMSGLASGTYFLRVSSGQTSQIVRVLKN